MCIINEKTTVKRRARAPSLAPPIARENIYCTQINYCCFMTVFREEYDFQPNVCTKCLLVVSHFHSVTGIFTSVSLLHTRLTKGTRKLVIICLEYLQLILPLL